MKEIRVILTHLWFTARYRDHMYSGDWVKQQRIVAFEKLELMSSIKPSLAAICYMDTVLQLLLCSFCKTTIKWWTKHLRIWSSSLFKAALRPNLKLWRRASADHWWSDMAMLLTLLFGSSSCSHENFRAGLRRMKSINRVWLGSASSQRCRSIDSQSLVRTRR